jgi:hypothetical protein
MNIEQAKAIPLAEILSRLGREPTSRRGHRLRYSSPLREEKTPSFDVDIHQNLWYDHGEGIGGDVVSFVCAYLKSTREAHTVSDALRWIRNMTGGYVMPPPPPYERINPEPALVLRSDKPIQHLGLVHYLQKRGIPLELARRHLREIHVRNQETGKGFFALGFKNVEGGYELRNPFFKGCLAPKAITFLRGSRPRPQSIHFFEGVMDCLSAMTLTPDGQLAGDAIVLNSLSCLKQVVPYVQNYGYRLAFTWMDNDKAGERATATLDEFFKTESGLVHKPMNALYAPHKDVNAWHTHKLGLAP